MMRILAAQAAISLENARLYEDMTSEVARRTRPKQALREALAEVEALKNRLEAENVYLQEEIRTQHNFERDRRQQSGAARRSAQGRARGADRLDGAHLGETGTGKELFARAVHSRSTRRDRPLVKVNCGAIPPAWSRASSSATSRAHSPARSRSAVGRFELADGGTIFLDEVGELPLDTQVKLLRVLQEQEFEPVGSSRTVRVDVRVIAATNRDLEQAVRDGTFRADLLYRLNVFPMQCRRCASATSDIPLLVGFFSAASCAKDREADSGLQRAEHGAPVQLLLAGQRTRAAERRRAGGDPGAGAGARARRARSGRRSRPASEAPVRPRDQAAPPTPESSRTCSACTSSTSEEHRRRGRRGARRRDDPGAAPQHAAQPHEEARHTTPARVKSKKRQETDPRTRHREIS